MNNNANSSLIQEWFVINDDRWARLLVTSPVRKPSRPTPAASPPLPDQTGPPGSPCLLQCPLPPDNWRGHRHVSDAAPAVEECADAPALAGHRARGTGHGSITSPPCSTQG